jgi:hypothetical protein
VGLASDAAAGVRGGGPGGRRRGSGPGRGGPRRPRT